MINMYGCAPIYLLGAILFLAGGVTLIYYDQPIIGAIVMVPSLVLLGLTFFTLVMLSRIKRGDNDVNVVIRDPEQLKNRQQKSIPNKKRKRKKRKR